MNRRHAKKIRGFWSDSGQGYRIHVGVGQATARLTPPVEVRINPSDWNDRVVDIGNMEDMMKYFGPQS